MNSVCEYLLEKEIRTLKENKLLTNREECWLEACERELIFIKGIQFSVINHGETREKFKERVCANRLFGVNESVTKMGGGYN